jgi:hypothetical protein
MAKSRSSRGKKQKTLKKRCEYPATFHGLHKWYEKMFEELGWMVLAHEKGMTDKIMVYKNSLDRLKTHLECKIHSVKEHDRKTDLHILLDNVKILIAHVHKDF